MIQILLLPFLLSFVTVAEAYNPSVVEPVRPYEVLVVAQEPEVTQEYLGALLDFPEMYETSSEEPFLLTVAVKQLVTETPVSFSLIAIRQNDVGGGVTEVFRKNQPVGDWTVEKNSVLGLTFLVSDTVEARVEPGTYRVEISTPINEGDYMLVLGNQLNPSGYFAMLGHIRTTQAHFGYSWLRMLYSSYVYYPLGSIVLLLLIFKTWQRRKKISHAT